MSCHVSLALSKRLSAVGNALTTSVTPRNTRLEQDIAGSSIFSQRILAMKTLSDKLEDNEAFTFRKEDTFGFNEILVNRLMLLAFLIGRIDIDKTSYDKGYEDAWVDVRKRLGIEEE